MRIATLCHTKMARELVALWVAVTTTTESVLQQSPNDTFHMEVVGELSIELQKVEDRLLRLEWPTARICDMLLGPPPL
jgi:hypothetical protein